MAGNKRKTPDINASSQADIAFLLLVFFLVATTMNTDKGITRVLPPIPPEDVKVRIRSRRSVTYCWCSSTALVS